MPIWVFAVVLFSSFFQAWWNFHLKKTPIDRSAFLVVGWFLFGLVATPISIFFLDKPFEWSWMYYIVATGVLQGLYLLILCWAYSVSDISMVFPVARGTSLGITALSLSLLGQSPLSGMGLAGIATIVTGAICLGSVDLKTARGRTGLLASLLIALIIGFYSVIDSYGALKIPVPFYVIVMNIIGPICAFPFVYHRRKADVIVAMKQYKLQGFIVGLAGSAAYIVAISMFKYAPPTYVLALREISIVFAAILGIVFLKESKPLRKLIGIGLILVGIIFIKLA
ncbi:MAG: EamA family transporter [Bdellovibrionaceae bacterium]|nr:EamA family transporter [Pseudobdellovibrionaceae bacterium]